MKPPLTNAEIDELAICAAHSVLTGDDGYNALEQNLADTLHEHGVSWDRAAEATDLMAKEFDRISPR